MKEIKKQLLVAIKNKSLFSLMHKLYIAEIRSKIEYLPSALSELHNESTIDLNKIFSNLSSEFDNNLFALVDLYCKTLPKIDADVMVTSECIKYLDNLSDTNAYTHSLLEAYINFCKVDESRSKRAVKEISTDQSSLISLLCPAIIASSFHDSAWALSQCSDLIKSKNTNVLDEISRAIGVINIGDAKGTDIGLSLLEELVKETQPIHIKATIFNSCVSLGKKNDTLWDRVNLILKVLLKDQEPLVLIESSRTAMFEILNIPQPTLDLIINSLQNTKIENPYILGNIDHLLVKLSSNSQTDLADSLVEALLLNNSDLEITQLDSFSYYLLNENKDNLNRILTKWFLSSDPKLCRSICDLTLGKEQRGLELSFDLSQLKDNEYHTIFVARKAIGWLFTSPVTVSSLMLSIYKEVSLVHKKQIEELLFEPLLLSYTGKLKRYFEDIEKKNDLEINEVIERLFTMLNQYNEDARLTSNINELKSPSENAHAYWKEFNRKFEDARENGRKSFIQDLFTTQHLLYGNSTAHYVYDKSGGQQRSELQMSSHSYSSELPKLNVIDPYGLDYMLRMFRVERLINEANT